MGEPSPTEWPELIADKWYKCTVNCYWGDHPVNTCSGAYIDNCTCCRLGADIDAYLKIPVECRSGSELCMFTGFSAQRVINVEGPYDDFDACVLDI